jgi:hypothetical protein
MVQTRSLRLKQKDQRFKAYINKGSLYKEHPRENKLKLRVCRLELLLSIERIDSL